MPDKVSVSSIHCVAAVGVSEEERMLRHRLSIDVEVSTDARRAATSDSLEDAIDYSRIVSLVVDLAQDGPYHLIETLAERIAARVLAELGGEQVLIRVRKMPPPLAAPIAYAGVEIVRRASDGG